MKQQKTTRYVVLAAVIAAAYIVLTYISATLGLAYGGIQFRVSEALNILAAFTPAAIFGLTIGCFISNIGSPFPLDMVFGTAATFLSTLTISLIAKRCSKSTPYISVLPPSVFNAILVGLQITFFTEAAASLTAFTLSPLSVFLGECSVCAIMGIPLYFMLNTHKNRLFK